MTKRDLASSLFWMAFGVIFVIGGLQHGLMESEGVPGRGAVPFLAGLACITLSLMVFFPALSNITKEIVAEVDPFFPEKNSLKRLLTAVALLALYGVFLKRLGYPLTTFLFLIGALRFIEPQRWRVTIVFSFLVASISYTMFEILKVNLPTGFLGL
jgi:hypothetical protein